MTNNYLQYVFDDYLICPITGKKFKCFNQHHLKSIGFDSFKDFQEVFKNFPYSCQELKNRRQVLANSANSSEKKRHAHKIRADNNALEYYTNPKHCPNCNNMLTYLQRKNRFCSQTCSAIYYNSKREISDNSRKKRSENAKAWSKTFQAKVSREKGLETRRQNRLEKIGLGLIIPKTVIHKERKKKNIEICGPFTKVYLCTCKITKIKWFSRTRKQIHPSVKENRKQYGYQARFTFALKHYPLWFESSFNLIKTYGWYGATNKGNDNPNGCSRDHMYSVYDGFKNNIDPKIISHPANCAIIQQKENQYKNRRSSITLEELLSRINQFESVYGKYQT